MVGKFRERVEWERRESVNRQRETTRSYQGKEMVTIPYQARLVGFLVDGRWQRRSRPRVIIAGNNTAAVHQLAWL